MNFQNVVSILFTLFKVLGFYVRTEIRSSRGICDMTVSTSGCNYIFEFKINSTPEKALEQIRKKGYTDRFAAAPHHLILIGAKFDTKTRTLDAWQIVELK